MSNLIRSLVAFSVALHAVFGCCAHHAHAAECAHGPSAVEACCDGHEHATESCCSDDATACEDACLADAGHSGPHTCDEGTCSLLVSGSKSQMLKVKYSPAFGVDSLSPPAILGVAANRNELSARIGTQRPYARVPLHLALKNLRV